MPGTEPALRTSKAHVIVDPEVLRVDDALVVDDDTTHHLSRVLRLRDGEVVSATDGEGAWRLAVVVASGSSWRLVPTTPCVQTARPPRVEVASAMPKGDRLDWLVQKVAEIGVDRLTLLHAERSVVRWKAGKADQQRARLQRIADEACRQSRRLWSVVVDGPHDALDVLPDAVVAEPGGRRLVAGDRIVAIGPEGGWSPAELAAARAHVELADTILRTETAAVVAATLCVGMER